MVRVSDRSPLWALSDSGVGNQPDSARLTAPSRWDSAWLWSRSENAADLDRTRRARRDGTGPSPAPAWLVGAALVAARSQRFAN